MRIINDLQRKQKYGLVFEDHPEDAVIDTLANIPVLEEVRENCVMGGGQDHILIEGENYASLLALSSQYKGKINVIYIDPPYNLGYNFIYNDHFIDKEDTWRHSKWLSFMNRRLKLAKELLSDDGVIFISIDDNEQAQLKLLCDQVFGEDRCIGCCAVVNNFSGRNYAKYFKTAHEYLLAYTKTDQFKMRSLPLTQEEINEYKQEDNISKYKTGHTLRRTGNNQYKEDRPNLFFPIYVDKENNIYVEPAKNRTKILPKTPDGKDGCWTWSKDKVKRDADEIIVKRPKNVINFYIKQRLTDDRGRWLKSLLYDPQYSTRTGTNILKDMGLKFNGPKPVKMIKDLLLAGGSKNSIILDFFAGSGTTLHAVAELNKEDGGQRKCILITNNENNICEKITYQRCKKVIEGYTTPKGKVIEPTNGNLHYYRLNWVEKD